MCDSRTRVGGLGGVPSGVVSLRRYVGSRNRPLASLAPGGQRSFPRAAGVPGVGFADAVLVPAGENIFPAPTGR